MIANATLTRLDTPGPSSAGGVIPIVTGSAVAVRCTLDEPSFSQRVALGAVIQDATAVAYVLTAGYPASLAAPARGQRMTIKLDGEANGTLFRILKVRDMVKAGGLSHWQCFLTTNL